jgi:hypothetical protein
MTLYLRKFGEILNGRPLAREAVLRAKQIINGADGGFSLDGSNSVSNDVLILDWSGVRVVMPGFADEFISGLQALYPEKQIEMQGVKSNSVLNDVLKIVGVEKVVAV